MESREQYIEDFGLFYERMGMPRMAGRIMAWLLICDPPEQTMAELTAALQASKSSISTATRLLIQFQMIERVSLPGIRPDFYRISSHFWEQSLQDAVQKFNAFRLMAERGLDLLQGEAPDRRHRLTEMRDVYLFLEREFPSLVEQWRHERST